MPRHEYPEEERTGRDAREDAFEHAAETVTGLKSVVKVTIDEPAKFRFGKREFNCLLTI
ncbi:MAG TPA: hypothetical protein VGR78_04650 [Verrucomicrobiae bacterium]|jgi:hypothetical protein|nr:hypothetical protein [Verrucomicrobiae bacterium]